MAPPQLTLGFMGAGPVLVLVLAGLATAALAAGAAVAPAQAPPPGTYAAQLCVAVAQAPAQCGAVEFNLEVGGQARLRVHDIVYRLQLREAEIDVFVFHGNMQIDEFSARYAWHGAALHFTDAAKGARYVVQVGSL